MFYLQIREAEEHEGFECDAGVDSCKDLEKGQELYWATMTWMFMASSLMRKSSVAGDYKWECCSPNPS